jgi:hypothetical protein
VEGDGTLVMDSEDVIDIDDVRTMITQLFRTVPGDFTLDGIVDTSDYVVARKGMGTADALFTQGDADFDRDVDNADLALWESNFGFVRQPLMAGGGSSSPAGVPEPHVLWLAVPAIGLTVSSRRFHRRTA